jgi:hypothetical protein
MLAWVVARGVHPSTRGASAVGKRKEMEDYVVSPLRARGH